MSTDDSINGDSEDIDDFEENNWYKTFWKITFIYKTVKMLCWSSLWNLWEYLLNFIVEDTAIYVKCNSNKIQKACIKK